MRRYGHYIWDFDGTLFDSYPHSAAALCAAARFYGAEAPYGAVYRALRLSFAEGYRLVGLNAEQLALFHRLRGDDAFPPPIAPFPRAAEVLEALAREGARHYLYTHSNRRMSVRFLERYGMDRWFAGYMTPDDPGFVAKPDPGAIRYLLDSFGIAPADAVMVGDREIDMRCALGAGVDGILVDPDRLVGETCARHRVDGLIEIIE